MLRHVLTTLGFEILVPLIATTVIFWAIVIPKLNDELRKLVLRSIRQLPIDKCNTLLHFLMPSLVELREGISKMHVGRQMRTLVAMINTVVIVMALTVAVAIPLYVRPALGEVLVALGEVVAVYAIVLLVQLYFLFQVAFQYVPVSSSVMEKELVSRISMDCFKSTLEFNDPTFGSCPAPA